MRQAWYRKYRPQTFGELIGQEHIKVTLLNQVKSGQIAHAYLFAGPKGTGKTSVARILARSANCLTPTEASESCGKCVNCAALNNNTLVDLMEVDAASHTGVDNIRELTARVDLAPSMGKYKVYVIDEAHMLSKGAFNALLKTLEEPPAHAIFILATTEPNKIPATIISRCQRFDFRHLSVVDVVGWLKIVASKETMDIDDEALSFLAEQGGGSMRDALSLLEQVSSIGTKMNKADLSRWLGFVDWVAMFELTEMLIDAKTADVLERINEIYGQGYDLHRVAEMWARVARQLLATKVGARVTVNEADALKLKGLAERVEMNDLIWLATKIMALPVDIKQAVLPQMPFELLAVQANEIFKNYKLKITKNSEKDDNISAPPTSEKKETIEGFREEASQEVATESMRGSGLTKEVWAEVVASISLTKPSVGAALSRATFEMNDGTLKLKFSLPFYKNAFEQNGYTRMLMEVLEAQGFGCKIECVVDATTTGGNQTGLEMDEVSKVFN
jgi:DNA polymerase-3 subunit gamma/tau